MTFCCYSIYFLLIFLFFSFFSFPPVLLLSFDLSAIIKKKNTFCIRGRDKSNDKKNLVPLFLLERVYKRKREAYRRH